MCTVSFIGKGNTYIITSNRDEHAERPTPYEPKAQEVNGRTLLFPKDPKAGGTWFAINDSNEIGVVLNGAFVCHQRKESYRRSRGLILLDIMSSKCPMAAVEQIDLSDIEQFTLVLFAANKLIELRWDGEKKHILPLNIDKGHIWSSTTLYEPEAIAERDKLFSEFMDLPGEKGRKEILDFHTNNGEDYENGFIIDRQDTQKKTFSVTQTIVQNGTCTLEHIDLLNQKSYLVKNEANALQNLS